MKTQKLTRSELARLTGAKPYQIAYLHSLGRLPTVRNSRGAGIPILWDFKAINVIKVYLTKNQ